MVGLGSAVIVLMYVGRVPAWALDTKPLEPGDVVFLVPVVVSRFLVLRRDVRPRSGQPTTVSEIDWIDEASHVSRLERSSEADADEGENLRQQEWAAAEYHWWKQ